MNLSDYKEAEKNLLGSIIQHPQNFFNLHTDLNKEDFSSAYNGEVWANLCAFIRERGADGLDLVSFFTYTQEKGSAEACGGIQHISSLTDNISSFASVDYFAKLIKESAIKTHTLKDLEDLQKNIKTLDPLEIISALKNSSEYLEKEAYKSASSERGYKEQYNTESLFNKYLETIEDTTDTPTYSTGFYKLDQLLDGGIKSGLTTIGAPSSLGKTTLCLQIADKIAKKNDVVYISLEQSRTELISKSLSRITGEVSREGNHGIRYALSQNQIQEGKRHNNFTAEQKEAYKEAICQYREIAQRLYFFEAQNDFNANTVKEIVKRHISYTGNKPVVFVDYLQLLEPLEAKMTDKQAVDTTVKVLKQLSRDYDLPIIVISSFNRGSYNSQASMSSYKESGIIEYSSDVALGLQYKGVGVAKTDSQAQQFEDEASKKTPREVELRIMKNRRGPKGDLIDFSYYPICNLYSEN